MNREYELNESLKDLAKIYSQNPELKITTDTIYAFLMNYDFNEDELEKSDIEHNFEKWANHFKNNPNIDVYHTSSQKRFLQFSNRHTHLKCVKLYVSFPKELMYDCVNKIFEYVAEHKMSTASKVADMVRSDSVVLRLDSEKDAREVINFINNNLSNQCKKTNPFMLRVGNVGVAYDYMLSYNSILSVLMKQYLIHYRNQKKLNEVSSYSFKNYVDSFRSVLLNNPKNLEIFLNNPDISKYLNRFNNDRIELLCNCDEVMELISKSLDKNMNLEDYFSFYNQCLDETTKEQKYSYYSDLLNENDKTNTKVIIKNPESLLNEYIHHAEKKYGSGEVHRYLKEYIYGNKNAITRDNNYRNLFSLYLPPSKIIEITNNNLIEYVNAHLEHKNKHTENYDAFMKSCIATFEKYGYSQLLGAIKSSMKGEFKYLSNGGCGYRDTLIKNKEFLDIPSYCKIMIQELGLMVSDLVSIEQQCAIAVQLHVDKKKLEENQIGER